MPQQQGTGKTPRRSSQSDTARADRIVKGTRAAARTTSDKRTSVTGRAASGAAKGAGAGAALGSVVPGIGTLAGAGAGAVIGGGAGAAGGARARAAERRAGRSSAHRLLIALFLVSMVIVAFSPLTDKHRNEPPAAFMKRASAVMGLYFVLGLISSAGAGAAKAATGLGGLVTVALLVSERNVLTVLAAKIGTDAGDTFPDDGPPVTVDDDEVSV